MRKLVYPLATRIHPTFVSFLFLQFQMPRQRAATGLQDIYSKRGEEIFLADGKSVRSSLSKLEAFTEAALESPLVATVNELDPVIIEGIAVFTQNPSQVRGPFPDTTPEESHEN